MSRGWIVFFLVFNAAALGWDVAVGIAGMVPVYVAGPLAGVALASTILFLASLIREDWR